MTRLKVRVHTPTRMAPITEGSGKTTSSMAKVSSSGQMAPCMRVSTSSEPKPAGADFHGQEALRMKANLLPTTSREQAPIRGVIGAFS